MSLKEEKKLLAGRLIIVTGDITELDTDCIVNAANSSLMGGGGVDGAIHRKAGQTLLEECKSIRNTQYPNGLPTGQAVITGAGKLKAKFIIHTVGPIWHETKNNLDDLLSQCYTNSLNLATTKGIKTIAFPAISTGVYGYPKEKAAKVVYQTVKKYLATQKLPEKIYLVFYTANDSRIFLDTIG